MYNFLDKNSLIAGLTKLTLFFKRIKRKAHILQITECAPQRNVFQEKESRSNWCSRSNSSAAIEVMSLNYFDMSCSTQHNVPASLIVNQSCWCVLNINCGSQTIIEPSGIRLCQMGYLLCHVQPGRFFVDIFEGNKVTEFSNRLITHLVKNISQLIIWTKP